MTAGRIGIVDYGMGNRRSVQKALEHLGADAPITRLRDVLEGCAGLVIPGVGAFPRAMASLHELGLVELIRAQARAGVPILGICLGMQLLFESSEELDPTQGIALIDGTVTGLAADGLRLPHIGWNEVRFERPSDLLETLPSGGCAFYHVHSLAPRPADSGVIVGTTEYGERFATIVEQDNIAGVQFHPEKSSAHGLRLLENFVRRCTSATIAVAGAVPPA